MTIERIPITLNLFKDVHAMDVPRRPPTAPPLTPTTAHTLSPANQLHASPPAYADSYPGHPYMQPSYALYALQPGHQLGPAFSYLNAYGPGHMHGMPSLPNGPATGLQGHAFCIASSSPPPACELDDYCEHCGHNSTTKAKLEALGFVLGDTLDKIPSVEYEKVGFKYLEWGCVIKADKAHRLLAKARH